MLLLSRPQAHTLALKFSIFNPQTKQAGAAALTGTSQASLSQNHIVVHNSVEKYESLINQLACFVGCNLQKPTKECADK